MTAKRSETARYLGLDLSLSPGLAVIEVRNRQPHLVTAVSLATTAKDSDAVRNSAVDAFISGNVYAHRPFDAVIREDFTSGRNKRATQTVFSAWAAADRALNAYGYAVNAHVSPTTVKKTLTGSGKAEKPEVAEAVRKYLRLPAEYKFAAGYDDSDACAVILAWLITEELITKE